MDYLSHDRFVDGNAAAGALAEIFAVDVTAADITCAACRRTAPLGAAHVYGRGPGLVFRCAGCQSILGRFTTTPGAAWLDLSGSVAWRIPLDEPHKD